MTAQTTPLPWRVDSSLPRYYGIYIRGPGDRIVARLTLASAASLGHERTNAEQLANAHLLAAAPRLLALARQYAEECGECAGTGVTPDDQDCGECRFIREVLAIASGRELP